jgi:hypothetical protein
MEYINPINFENARRLGNIVISNDTVRPLCTLHGQDFLVENHTFGSDSVITNEPFRGGQVVVNRALRKDAELFQWESQVRSFIGDETRESLNGILLANAYSPAQSKRISQRLEKEIPVATFGSGFDNVVISLSGGKKIEVGDSNIEIIDNMGSVTYQRSAENDDTPYENIPLYIESNEFFGDLLIPSGIQIESQLRLLRIPQKKWKVALGNAIQSGTFTSEIVKLFVNLSFAISRDSQLNYA